MLKNGKAQSDEQVAPKVYDLNILYVESVCATNFALYLCFECLVDSEFARLDAVYAKYELLYDNQYVYKLLPLLCRLP